MFIVFAVISLIFLGLSHMCTYNFKSLTPAYDSSESDDDFDKAFQPLIIESNMFLGDTWWTHRKWKTSNAGQIFYFWSFDYSHESHNYGKKHMIFRNIGNLTDHSHQKWTIIMIILNKLLVSFWKMDSSLVVPKWFLYKARYWFFHFQAQGNNSSWRFRINYCKDWFQLNKTTTARIIISKLFVMIQW